jgi:UDP-N-acetylglucosamine:LPS N-acetylglucosamine transferase
MTKYDLSQLHNFETPTLENMSPVVEGGQSWIGGGDEISEGVATTKYEHKKKNNKNENSKTRGLTLLRAKVVEYVREILKPKWKEGIITKEAFKIISKKAVDKVIGTVKPPLIPNTVEKVATYMNAARSKILKLVQVIIDLYY